MQIEGKYLLTTRCLCIQTWSQYTKYLCQTPILLFQHLHCSIIYAIIFCGVHSQVHMQWKALWINRNWWQGCISESLLYRHWWIKYYQINPHFIYQNIPLTQINILTIKSNLRLITGVMYLCCILVCIASHQIKWGTLQA